MATRRTLGEMLADWVGPPEAEAKIRGTSEAMETLDDVWADAYGRRGAYLPDRYRQIFTAAEARPDVVYVQPEPTLARGGNAGIFRGAQVPMRVGYVPQERYETGDTLAHELLHFLSATSPSQRGAWPARRLLDLLAYRRRVPSDREHDLIDQLLGTSQYGPAERAQGAHWAYPAPALSWRDQQVIDQWFRGTPSAEEESPADTAGR